MSLRVSKPCALAIAVSASIAQADVQAPYVEEMIVTGSRVLERIDEVPASVTVISAAEIADDIKVNSELSSLLGMRVPGMSATTGSSSNSGQNLRGRAPLILIDGVPQSTPLRNGKLGIRSIDAGVIEHIEVIKGATSVYGNGAAGGVINYITKKARTESPLNGELAFGTNFSAINTEDTLGTRIQLGVDGGIDQFSYLINGVLENNGVQRDAEGDVIGLQYGLSDVESRNLLTKFGFNFNDKNIVSLSYNYYEGRQDTDYVNVHGSVNSGVKSYAIKNGEKIPGEPQGPDGNENITLKYVSEDWFGNTNFTVDLYQQKINNVFFYSTRLADFDKGFEGGQSRIVSDKDGLRVNFNTSLNFSGVETTIIYGVDAISDTTKQDLVDGRIWVPEMEMENFAPYLQTKFVFAEDWVLKAGVRREDIDVSVADYETMNRCSAPGVCTGSVSVTGGDIQYEATTYNFGFRYNGIEAFNPFFSYSEGFDVSDLGRLLRAATVTDIKQVRTEASIVENKEVGFSGAINKLSYAFAYYESYSELGTVNVFNTVTGYYDPVRAPQDIWGYEAAIDYTLSDNISFGMTYTWVEGKNKEAGKYLSGREISPPKFTAYIDWQVSENLDVSVDWLNSGSRDRFQPNDAGNYVGDEGPVSGFDLVNLRASYQFKAWNTYVGIENIFNEDYYPAISEAITYSGYNTKGRGRWLTLCAIYQF